MGVDRFFSMCQIIIFSVGLWANLLAPESAAGGDWRQLHVEMSYSGSAVSYNLYKNNALACEHLSPSALDCLVDLDAIPMAFSLTALDATGLESMPSAPFLLDPLPKANFTAAISSTATPLSLHFDASTSSDYSGFITSYAWDFGDGAIGVGQFIKHIYAAAGNYAVRLTVVNDSGAINEKSNFITILGASAAGVPATITVPASDTDGSYPVIWAASATAGVSYTLEEATNSAFTLGLRTTYSGTALSTIISGRLNGVTYYYRVKASKTGYTASGWTSGTTGCLVTIRAGVPATITVPASDPDGSYPVSWAASATAGVSYTLEEAANSTFTIGLRTAYSGTALNTIISGRLNGVTYFYRVKASKTGYTASAWTTKAIGCVVTIPMQSITYNWDYPATIPSLVGFKLYMNNTLACKTANPAARRLTCIVPKITGAKSFFLTAVDADGTETAPSNSLKFIP